jgi:two-component system, chemotaxis family, CheB/CheR fusion protein
LLVQSRIVGIGASAGGVEALRGFFTNVSADAGLAFVVVLHLAPDRESKLAEVLRQWTSMPVAFACDGVAVKHDHVYVNPPATALTIESGSLRLRALGSTREPTVIDVFLSSLAHDQRGNAVGVVLSGTGSDGALGLKAIKEGGGVAIAQGHNGHGPQYGDMPAAAIATGSVDLILPVEAMGERIIGLRELTNGELTNGELGDAADALAPALPPSEAQAFQAAKATISELLRGQVGHDFSGYKQETFMRRVHRRRQLLGLDMAAYVERMRDDSNEGALLFRDLLIGVTSFFRNAEAFRAVETVVMPLLFRGKGPDGAVRVWVPGCATGEEAYSLAILLHEHKARMRAPPNIQVFATDIDEAAVAVARLGRYPAPLLKDISRERIEHFFSRSDGSCVVSKTIRDLCTFSAHSVIRDPPFSRMDMISCRNLLIYLDTELQGRVIPAFHYSLMRDGILLLGGSEAVTRHADLFTLLDKKNRIFQRRDMPSPPLQVTATAAAGRTGSALTGGQTDGFSRRSEVAALAQNRVLNRFAPAFVVVNSEFEVRHYSGGTGKYLEPAAGTPSNNLVAMARSGLKRHLRASLRQSLATGRTVRHDHIDFAADGSHGTISLIIEPLPDQGPERLFLVLFADAVPEHDTSESAAPIAGDGEAMFDHVERELREAREQLQSVTEEYEAALEELKSSNEELHSVNEELQSTNEEMETSKEEIQSMNEELQAVNVQLVSKIEQLDRTNSDLRNLFDSTQVATIFLDRFLIVRGFTPAVSGIYNLIASDQGRPLTDIASQIDYTTLREDVQQVLDTKALLQRRVARQDSANHYLMRMLPYRAKDNSIDGTLITFVDVTSLVQAERHDRLLVDELNHRVKNMLAVVSSLAHQTLRGKDNLEAFSDSFLGRLHALAAAYAVLTRDSWTEVPLRDLIGEQLRPAMIGTAGKIVLHGPLLYLRPKGALALGMVVHELATNAVRYGALSVPGGHVEVAWRLDESDNPQRLVWTWHERNGPLVVPAGAYGFGLTLIQRTLSHELSGVAEIRFDIAGVVVTLTFPLDPTVAVTAAQRGAVGVQAT